MRSIGKGAFGKNYLGEADLVENTSTGKLYVAKHIQTVKMPAEEIRKAYLEAETMKRCMHPNIVQYIEGFITSSEIIIIMEQCAGGDLSQLISYHKKNSSFFPEQTILDWLNQMLSALKHIHSLKIIHRDIKPANIFVTLDGKLKFGDFGISKTLDSTNDVALTQIGTPLYLSPEVCDNLPYTNKSDIWSLGCVVYELATFEKPFMANSLVALAMQIIEDQPRDIGNRYSNKFQQLIDIMLQKDPKRRLSAKEIMEFMGMDDVVDIEVSIENIINEPWFAETMDFSKTFAAETVVRMKRYDKTAGNELYEDDFESVRDM